MEGLLPWLLMLLLLDRGSPEPGRAVDALDWALESAGGRVALLSTTLHAGKQFSYKNKKKVPLRITRPI